MLLASSELTKEDRESQLYDEFECFKMILGENITDYYVRFYKLVNDMRNIKMMMPNIQLNSKFVNNMTPEWDRFVTAVKLNKGLKETNHEQVYAYLKQHEKHAAYDRLINEKFNPITNDPLALVSHVQPRTQILHVQSHQYETPSSSVQPLHADDCDAFDSDIDDEPTAQTIFMANLSSVVSSLQQDGPSNASILSEYNKESVVPSGASSVQYDYYMLHENSAYVPDDSFTTTLNIYKDQVATYKQRAKFKLTDREQKMDDQMCMLI
nr:UBN2 domain-containing protein [Tanacetum cinerariifolium]